MGRRTTSYYEFGPFHLDPVKRLLSRDGESLPLTQKAFDTLLVLVQNSERVVDKDQLMRVVWPDTIVEENNLTQSISALRKALGESRKDHKYIVTIQGRGYRFVAGVREVYDENTDLILVGHTRASILIEEEAENEVEATTSVATPNLHPAFYRPVALRTRAMVALVLLAGMCGGFYLWQVSSARQPESSATTVRSVAVVPFKSLGTDAVDKYLSSGIADHYTDGPEAYQAYIKGRYFWNKRTEAGLVKAIEYFRHAINVDQNYALAYSGLADSYLMIATYHYSSLPPEEATQIARSAAIKALELDETLAEAHTSLAAFLESTGGDLPGAEREYKRAIELNPNYATARQWYGEFLRSRERFDEALVELKRAQELDPLSPIMNSSLGVSYYYARQYDLVIEQNRKALEIDPNFTPAHFGLGLAFEQKRMYEDAIAEFQRAKDLSSGGEPMIAALAHAYAKSGDRARALRVFRELKEKRKPASAYNLALFYVAFGEKEKALPLLQKAREETGDHMMLKLDPRLDGLRSDSTFDEVFKS
ncbi:MAG: winged helix-turn-helix domain-containing protein [Pyrinomonadaceae bacterium]